MGEVSRIAGFGVAALGTRAVDVSKLITIGTGLRTIWGRPPCHWACRHPTARATEREIHRRSPATEFSVCRRRPVARIIGFAALIGNYRTVEERADGSRASRIGGPGVVHDALQLLDARQTPVIMAKVFSRVLLLNPGEGFLPVHALAAVRLGPDKACSPVGDGAVGVVVKVVLAIPRVAAHALHEKRLFPAAWHLQIVPFDPTIGEIDPEEFAQPTRRLADILGARRILGINDALAGACIPVGELKELRIDVGREAGSIRALRTAWIGATAVKERVKLLNRRQSPIVETSKLGGVEFGGELLGLSPGQLVLAGKDAIPVGVRAALPGQTRVVVIDGLPILAQRVTRFVAGELCILPIERLSRFRWSDLVSVVVALGLARIDDAIWQRSRLRCWLPPRLRLGLADQGAAQKQNGEEGRYVSVLPHLLGLLAKLLHSATRRSTAVL